MLGFAQVWLQDYAWCEADKSGQMAQRVAQATEAHERAQLAGSPLFCFETVGLAWVWG